MHVICLFSASYSLKPEAPDNVSVLKFVERFLKNCAEQTNEAPTLQQRLKGLCDALLSSTTVGACQAVYFLLGLPYVESSRKYLDVNIQPHHQLSVAVITDVDILSQLGPNEPIYKRGSIMSQAGRRDLYAAFCKQQLPLMPSVKRRRDGRVWRRRNEVSFAAFLSNYHYWKPRGDRHQRKHGHQPPALTLKEATMRVVPKNEDPRNLSHTFTLIVDAEPVAVQQYNVGDEHVLVYHPHLAVDYNDDAKCWALLLMHLPWNEHGEAGLLLHPLEDELPFMSAIDAVKYYLNNEGVCAAGFPLYVGPALKEQLANQDRRAQDAEDRLIRQQEDADDWGERDGDNTSRRLYTEEDYLYVDAGYDSDDRFDEHDNGGDDEMNTDATFAFAETSSVRHDMSRQNWKTYKSFVENENRRFITNCESANERRGTSGVCLERRLFG